MATVRDWPALLLFGAASVVALIISLAPFAGSPVYNRLLHLGGEPILSSEFRLIWRGTIELELGDLGATCSSIEDLSAKEATVMIWPDRASSSGDHEEAAKIVMEECERAELLRYFESLE